MTGPTTLLSRFREFVLARELYAPGDRLVTAVSGGVDSVVLLDLLAEERERSGITIVIAHFNHGLRPGAAEEDAAFVQRLGSLYAVPVHLGSGPVKEEAQRQRRGLEDAARTLRYAFLEQVRVDTGSTRIATGHHADDNAETVLLNLLRGSGVRGLAGIPATRDNGRIVRPLLFATREEIQAYAAARGLQWRDDASNDSEAHRRNIVRHQLLPVIREKLNPGIAHTLMRTAEVFGELDRHMSHVARTGLDQVITRRTGGEMRLSCTHLLTYPTAIQDRMLQFAVQECTGLQPGAERVAACAALLHRQPGKRAGIGGGWMVVREPDELVIRATVTHAPFAVPVTVGTLCATPGGDVATELMERPPAFPPHDAHREYVDADRTGTQGLVVRSWNDGDACVPLGMSGHKNVSDLLNDAGIRWPAKAAHPLLTAAGGEIIWVCGVRLADQFKITTGTRNVLQLTYQRPLDHVHGEAAEDQR